MKKKLTISQLRKDALEIRRMVLRMIVAAHASHIAPAYSIVELLVYLYSNLLHIPSPKDPERDRFILSKGWGIAALYSVLAQKGFIDESLLDTYCQDGSKLIGIATYNGVAGIEASTGSIGHGLPLGIGMAIGMRLSGIKRKVYILMGDGEMDEGTTWESALIAGHHKLDNVVAIVDYNKWQSFGKTNEVLNLEPLRAKWESFGWNVMEIDGHDFTDIAKGFSTTAKIKNKPSILIAHTVKGKGLSFMENNNDYHYMTPGAKELAIAKEEGLI